MNTQILKITQSLQETLTGDPWYGRSLYSLLDQVDPSTVFVNPDEKGHALIELLYHIINWAQFVQSRLENDDTKDVRYYEQYDWRVIDPTIHTWKNGVKELKATNQHILDLLNNCEDSVLEDPVPHRAYNVGYMLDGYIQHNIYHLGQMFYVKKLLD
ncbi:DinB family protein [Paraflavitalea sp. CAU 1676]|uniref:DinB family protein n=1 Tax=Paraflavitalea sp. CAU 1676 TaxID=3032598 RepID=UPI0023DC09B6|nr:DinB family protein [Paraflavitalea sp. CAU 1676]MDF2193611.1 DinB family protein [Paraflavitalea sp. CAU 1676]